MITEDLLCSLSNSLEQLYETGEDHNVIIEVGKDLNDVKAFKVHSSILRSRSTYFKSALSNNWSMIKDNIIYFNKPNISPNIFDIILRYIYTGNINFEKEDDEEDEEDVTQLIDLMIAADEMDLGEIISNVQQYIIQHHWKFIRENFILFYKIFVKMYSSPHFKELKKYIEGMLYYKPQLLFNMKDAHLLEESSLISIIRSNHINMLEYDIWERVLEWGISRTNIKSREFDTWTKEEFNELKDKLCNVLPLIKFQEMFLNQFQKESIIISNLIPFGRFNKLLLDFPPTSIDSIIVTEKNAAIWSNMIDKFRDKKETIWSDNIDKMEKEIVPKENPYEYKLILRQNKDSLNFLELTTLEDTNNTMIICKLDGEFKIVGGFYSGCWEVKENNGSRKLVLGNCFSLKFKSRNFKEYSNFNAFQLNNEALWEFDLNNNKLVITLKNFLGNIHSYKIKPEILEIFKLERR